MPPFELPPIPPTGFVLAEEPTINRPAEFSREAHPVVGQAESKAITAPDGTSHAVNVARIAALSALQIRIFIFALHLQNF